MIKAQRDSEMNPFTLKPFGARLIQANLGNPLKEADILGTPWFQPTDGTKVKLENAAP